MRPFATDRARMLPLVVLAALVVFGCHARVSAATLLGDSADDAVVWVSTGNAGAPIVSEMRNIDKTFSPDVVVIPAGSIVRFPNEDPFFHSVFSAGPVDAFDVGYYSTGPGKQFLFSDPGVVDVRCHIHAMMHATIVVVDGPWMHGPTFVFRDVAAGAHVLHVWDPRAGERRLLVDVPFRTSAIVRVSLR